MPANEDERLLGDGNGGSLDASQLQQAKDQRAIENDVVPETAAIGRNIGWASAYILVISRVIGSGIYAMPGNIVQNVGSPGLALLLWVLGSVMAAAGFAVDLEFGCMLPRSGGTKVYLEYTYRWPRFLASTMVAVQAVLLGFSANNCTIFAKYTLFATGRESRDVDTKMLALGLLTTIVLVHGCFYKTGIAIQNGLGWIKLALILFMICTGLFVTLLRPSSAGAASNRDGFWEDSDWAWNNLSTGLFKVFYSYAGLNNLNNVLNEVQNPVRTLKSVGSVALLTACCMYVLVNVAYFAVVPLDEIKQSRELIAALFFSRLFGSGFGNVVLPLAIALSAVGNVMVVTFSLARLNQEVARQGFLPYACVLASSKPFDSPLGGLLVHYVPTALIIVLTPARSVYGFIADVEGYAHSFYNLALAIGLLLLRRHRPELGRPFRAWRAAIWLRVLSCVALIAAPLFPPPKGTADVDFFYATYALVGIAILLFGVVYWVIWTRLIPQYRGYQLDEDVDILDDGTTVTRMIRKRIE